MKVIRVTKSGKTDNIRYYSVMLFDLIGFSFMAGLISGIHIAIGLIVYKLEFSLNVSQWEFKIEDKNENTR